MRSVLTKLKQLRRKFKNDDFRFKTNVIRFVINWLNEFKIKNCHPVLFVMLILRWASAENQKIVIQSLQVCQDYALLDKEDIRVNFLRNLN